jgi:hypothetical protein
VETNFVMSHCLGRDSSTEVLLANSLLNLQLVIPAVCIMEAFSAFEDERKRHNRLVGELEQQVRQLERNVVSPRIQTLIDHLTRSVIEFTAIFNDTQSRLVDAIETLRTSANSLA